MIKNILSLFFLLNKRIKGVIIKERGMDRIGEEN